MERRKQDWEEFLKEQSRLKGEVDEEHAKAVGRLSAQYDEMKKDLAKHSSFWTFNLCVTVNVLNVFLLMTCQCVVQLFPFFHFVDTVDAVDDDIK